MDPLEHLKSRMRACEICTDLPLGPRPIFQLDRRARILIAGQAPGRITHARGRPFDDPSGERLRDWLGIDKDAFYHDCRVAIFPMALCFPGTGTGGDKPPPRICAQTWRQPVLETLANVELTLILGAYAIDWHLPDMKRNTVAQSVWQSAQDEDGVYVLPHPSPRNNRWLRTNPWFEADILPDIRQKAGQILTQPSVDSPEDLTQ